MPLDSTPRSLPFSIFLPPGRVEWSRATGTISPGWMFQAPVTIWMGALWPTSSWQIHMWSESGWRSMVRMVPTTILEISAPRSSVVSTLEPERVMASAKSLLLASTCTNSSSHFLLSNISSITPLYRNAGVPRKSLAEFHAAGVKKYPVIFGRTRACRKFPDSAALGGVHQ